MFFLIRNSISFFNKLFLSTSLSESLYGSDIIPPFFYNGYKFNKNVQKLLILFYKGCIITFENNGKGWSSEDQDLEKQIAAYNKKKDRFLFYPWGVFITAYCRRDIWQYGIMKAGKDYAYCDTDSVKFLGDHPGFEKEYNKIILKKILKACRYHGINISRAAPKTKDGIIKPLGVFEFDGHYSKFKTLGAKRYMMLYSDDKRNKAKERGELKITVAGLNKKKGAEYISKFPDPFKVFSDDMTVPKGYSGRQTATYKWDSNRLFREYCRISRTVLSASGRVRVYYEHVKRLYQLFAGNTGG